MLAKKEIQLQTGLWTGGVLYNNTLGKDRLEFNSNSLSPERQQENFDWTQQQGQQGTDFVYKCCKGSYWKQHETWRKECEISLLSLKTISLFLLGLHQGLKGELKEIDYFACLSMQRYIFLFLHLIIFISSIWGIFRIARCHNFSGTILVFKIHPICS